MSISITHTEEGHAGDVVDIFASLFNISIALNAIRKTLPDEQAESVSLAVEGLNKGIVGLMSRYDIKVSIDDEGGDGAGAQV